jgi:hypothetical protein
LTGRRGFAFGGQIDGAPSGEQVRGSPARPGRGIAQVFQHVASPRLGVVGVERRIGRARQQDAVDARQHRGGAAGAQADHVAGAHPRRAQPRRDGGGAGGEPGIVQAFGFGQDGGRGRGSAVCSRKG